MKSIALTEVQKLQKMKIKTLNDTNLLIRMYQIPQERIAQFTGISQPAISQQLSGKTALTLSVVLAVNWLVENEYGIEKKED